MKLTLSWRKTMLFAGIFLLLSTVCVSQETVSFSKIDIGPHGINAGYESALADKLVLNSGIGIGGGYYADDSLEDETVGYYLNLSSPVFIAFAEGKYFTNSEKRMDRGKITSLNSANYIGYQVKYAAANDWDNKNNQSLLNEVHWGIQRRLSEESRFLFNFHLGVGYLADFDTKENNFLPTLGGKFSFKIF